MDALVKGIFQGVDWEPVGWEWDDTQQDVHIFFIFLSFLNHVIQHLFNKGVLN